MNEFRMRQRIVQQTLLVLYFLLSYNGVKGEKKLSELEDMKLEKQLKLLNKPAVKIIKTKHGDTYNCIDFYKQHAFDHPLLKNHNFHPEMKPTLTRIKQNSDGTTASRTSTIWPKYGGCPSGTVPVRRITKDDLIRQKSMPPPENVKFEDQFVDSNNNSQQKGSYISSQGYKLAIVRTLNKPDNKFMGAGMITSLYNPHVEGHQHSACRLKVHNGRDILQVGWRVDPTLYGDNQTRLFIHFQAGKIYCFNTLCPGFVQVNRRIPLDMSYKDRISQPGTKVFEDTMYIVKDLTDGNWWLLMGENSEKIGFWPQKIFTDLASFAMKVEWGGVAYSPPGVSEPSMGSGNYPIEDIHSDAYCKTITIFNEKGEKIEVHRVMIRVDNHNMYDLLFERLKDGANTFSYVLYGGPGGSG